MTTRNEDEDRTRQEAADVLGWHKSKLRRMEKTREARPVVNAKGHHMYSPEEIARLNGGRPVPRKAKARAAVPGVRAATATGVVMETTAPDGETTADVFERLQRGVALAEIVIELRLPAATVERVLDDWRWMTRTLVAKPDEMKEFRTVPGMARVRTMAEVVEGLFKALKGRRAACQQCGRTEAHVCVDCANAHCEARLDTLDREHALVVLDMDKALNAALSGATHPTHTLTRRKRRGGVRDATREPLSSASPTLAGDAGPVADLQSAPAGEREAVLPAEEPGSGGTSGEGTRTFPE